ncbi:MAG: efflux RND transporter periplasmic adaptor subunit, partial [Acidobacteria bacterium]|nr:efflux RND transporter periplasmic adaptor subunit [Acidobacteriota bacterium]
IFTIKDDKTEYTSTINYVAASAEETTRMASITATIDDEKREKLRPGAFAEIHIPVGSVKDVPVIPQLAIRPSERGFIAYVVEDGKAKERILTLGMRTAEGQVEIRDGLKAGEALVIRGAEALQDGVSVRVTRADGMDTIPTALTEQPGKGKKG